MVAAVSVSSRSRVPIPPPRSPLSASALLSCLSFLASAVRPQDAIAAMTAASRSSRRLFATVVVRVVVGVPLEIDAVEHGADEPRLRPAPAARPRVFAACRLVISAPTTNTTPVALCATSAASVTAITGGESMITQSKCSFSDARKSRKRCEPSSSAGFGGIRPAGITHRPATLVLRMASLALAFPTSRFDRPGSCAHLEHLVHLRPAHVGVDEQHALARPAPARWRDCSPPRSCLRRDRCS